MSGLLLHHWSGIPSVGEGVISVFRICVILFSGLPHLLPQMATPSGLLMPATAAAMCNTFIPAAHLQHILAQAYPAPMTPESSPSAPSVSSSNPTPPRNVTPVNQDQKPVIVVTKPSGDKSVATAADVDKIPVGVLDFEPTTPSPRSVHSSPGRSSPRDNHIREGEVEPASEVLKQKPFSRNADSLPALQKEQKRKCK